MKKLLLFFIATITGISVSAQITSATFGMMEARQIGPATMGGRTTAIEGVNNEPRTLYIGTAGGGVWKTTNAGVSFQSVFDKYCHSIGALAIDQMDLLALVRMAELHERLGEDVPAAERWTAVLMLSSTIKDPSPEFAAILRHAKQFVAEQKRKLDDAVEAALADQLSEANGRDRRRMQAAADAWLGRGGHAAARFDLLEVGRRRPLLLGLGERSAHPQ